MCLRRATIIRLDGKEIRWLLQMQSTQDRQVMVFTIVLELFQEA